MHYYDQFERDPNTIREFSAEEIGIIEKKSSPFSTRDARIEQNSTVLMYRGD